MTKPSLYFDTNVLSVLHYSGNDIQCQSRQLITSEWWQTERRIFSLLTSKFTLIELQRGEWFGQYKASALGKRLKPLTFSRKVRELADVLLKRRIVPDAKDGDAIHLAFTLVYKVDYSLTWNYAHLANPNVERNLRKACNDFGWRMPILVSPESIPKQTLGQSIEWSSQ